MYHNCDSPNGGRKRICIIYIYMSSCMTNRNRCMGGNDIEASRSPGSSETSPLCPSPYLVFPWCIPWYPSSGSLGLPWCLRDISPVLCPLPSATPLGGMPPRSWPECRMPKQLNGTLTMNSVVKTHICSKVYSFIPEMNSSGSDLLKEHQSTYMHQIQSEYMHQAARRLPLHHASPPRTIFQLILVEACTLRNTVSTSNTNAGF